MHFCLLSIRPKPSPSWSPSACNSIGLLLSKPTQRWLLHDSSHRFRTMSRPWLVRHRSVSTSWIISPCNIVESKRFWCSEWTTWNSLARPSLNFFRALPGWQSTITRAPPSWHCFLGLIVHFFLNSLSLQFVRHDMHHHFSSACSCHKWPSSQWSRRRKDSSPLEDDFRFKGSAVESVVADLEGL